MILAALLTSQVFVAPLAAAEHPCAECHAAIVQTYANHGMARALYELDAGTVDAVAGSARLDPKGGYTYRVERSESGARLVEEKAGPAGFDDHRSSQRIRAVIGRGHFDRSLVTEHEGRLFFAPVEWSTTAGLVLAPHQELTPHTRLGQPVTGECLACHSDFEPPSTYPLNLAPAAPLAGIDCAGCHGDPSRHLEEAGERGTITPLGALPPERQLDVCARCHLQGDARIDLRGPGAERFAPGDDLFATRAAFVPRRPGDEFGFVSAVERLALSACFTASDGRLACTVCHDPHESAIGTAAKIDRSCLGCHAPADCGRELRDERADRNGCVECHMRKAGPFDLRHVTITDHFIRKRFAAPSWPDEIRVHAAEDGDLVRFRWPGASSDPLEDDGALAMALMHLGHAGRAIETFERVIDAGVPDSLSRLPRFHFMLGRALEAAGRPADAERAYETTLGLAPGDPEASVNLGLLLALKGDERARAVLDAVTTSHPRAAAPWRNLAVLASRRRDADEFERSITEALRRDSDLPSVWLQLGGFQIDRRDYAAAAHALEEARRRDPDLAGLYSRLGVARFETGDRRGARRAFEEALRRDPDDRLARAGLARSGGG